MIVSWLADQRLPWAELVRRAKHAAEFGYGGVWLSDHLIDEDGQWLLDCWTTLGALMVAVPEVELGTLVAASTLRNPVITTHMARALLRIGQGRFVLGLGAGGSAEDHRVAGVAFPDLVERAARLDETCRLLRDVLPGSEAQPGESQRRRRSAVAWAGGTVPLLIGGASEQVLKIAARHADRWTIWASPERAADLRGSLARYCTDAGRDVRAIRCGAIVMMTPEHLPQRYPGASWPAVMEGDIASMRRQVRQYELAGIDELVICDYAVVPDHQCQALRWFAERVAS